MCLAVVALGTHPGVPLVIAANRDEFHSRPDIPAGWWPDHPTVLGGRDAVTGGSWCAIDRRGRFALVMNPLNRPGGTAGGPARGRSRLVTDWVTSDARPLEYLDGLRANPGPWRDFRLVIGDLAGGLAGITHARGVFSEPWQLATGLCCTDSGPDAQPWPKRRFLANRARGLLEAGSTDETAWLALLARREPVPVDFGTADYPALRTPFITGQRLGTRACTVIRVLATGDCHFVEHRFGPDALPLGSRAFDFALSRGMTAASFTPRPPAPDKSRTGASANIAAADPDGW